MPYADDITYPLGADASEDKAIGFIIGAYRDDPTSVRIAVVDPDEYIELGEVTVNLGSALRDSEPMPMWTAYLADPPEMPGLVERMESVGLAHKEMVGDALVGHRGDDGAWSQRYVLDRAQFADYDRVGCANFEDGYDHAIARTNPVVRDAAGRPKHLREYTAEQRREIQAAIARKMTAALGIAADTPESAAELRHERMATLRERLTPEAADLETEMTLPVYMDMAGGPDAKVVRIKPSEALRQGLTPDEIEGRVLSSAETLEMKGDSTVAEWAMQVIEDRGVPALKITMPEGTTLPSGRDVSGMVATLPYFGKARPGDFERPGATPEDTGCVGISLPRNGVVTLTGVERSVERVEKVRSAKLLDSTDGLAHGQWHEKRIEHERVRETSRLDTTVEHLFTAIAANPEHARQVAAAQERMSANRERSMAATRTDHASPHEEMDALKQVAAQARRTTNDNRRGARQ